MRKNSCASAKINPYLKYTIIYVFSNPFFLILQAITSSVTELAKPENDDPEEFRKHLPTPQLRLFAGTDAKQCKDKKPAWEAVVNERLQQKTRRFNSVSRFVNYIYHVY